MSGREWLVEYEIKIVKIVEEVEGFASRQWWGSSDFVAWRSPMGDIQVQQISICCSQLC